VIEGVNADIRMALQDAERALGAGDPAAANRGYLDAGDIAITFQLWRSAARAYRNALELDLVSVETVGKLVALGAKLPMLAPEWTAYAIALRRHPEWPHFGCRSAQISIADRGAFVECATIGKVLELAMSADDHFDAVADPRFADMPLAMALVIVRRALWPHARERSQQPPARVRITFAGRTVWLDEHGEWERV
jgi:hypothetical protein